MSTLFITCGPPGAGKTTVARAIEARRNALRLTADEWILDLYAGESLGRDWFTKRAVLNAKRDVVERLQWAVAIAVLTNGGNVVLDWGLWTRAERDRYRGEAQRVGARVVLCATNSDREELLRRLHDRNANLPAGTFHIPDDELDRALGYFEMPDAAEVALFDGVETFSSSALGPRPHLVSVTGGMTPRLKIRFHPESHQPDLVAAASEYQRLWDAEGDRILEQLTAATGLSFVEHAIDAQVFEGVSQSDPLRLRASYDEETKLGTLIHELAHRLVRGRGVRSTAEADRAGRTRENHELIDLFLFDVWSDLYGPGFALRQVEVESQRRPMYRAAWSATLTLDRAGRAENLRALLRTPQSSP